MPSTERPHPNEGIAFRVYALETMSKTQDSAISEQRANHARLSEAVAHQGATLAAHEEQLKGGVRDMNEVKTDVAALAVSVGLLAEKVASVGNRVAWTLTAATLTVLGAMLVDKI